MDPLAQMNDFQKFLNESTIISGVPNYIPVMAGVGFVAYLVFMRDRK